DIVIYESTVSPGTTEEVCIPILEKNSNLKINVDFHVGYSPERINIGKNGKKTSEIIKITSGSNDEASEIIDKLYNSVINAGTHNVECIKIAEAAKIFENCQRDVNIAFINEMYKICNSLEINFSKVLAACKTKWNFINFFPGLVGGNCIPVDPYFLIDELNKKKRKNSLIEVSRKINESMKSYIYTKLLKEIKKNSSNYKHIKCLYLGLTYKKNCSAFSNSESIKIAKKLMKILNVTFVDDNIDAKYFNEKINITKSNKINRKKFDVIVISVAHDEYLNFDYSKIAKGNTIVYNITGENILADHKRINIVKLV
ncbi:nucleotide sugar dehydrogenase, partial [bacterium]|nr:nucleotide sugar dehydrogenase [bacterium]